MDIKNRLLEIRNKLNLSQKEFANKLKTGQSVISNYENGKRKPELAYIHKLNIIFQIDINWLLTGQGEMFINKNIPNDNINSYSTPEEIIESITNELKKIDDSKVLDYVNDEIRTFVKRQKMKKEDGVILNLI